MKREQIRVGLLGVGTVGRGILELLRMNSKTVEGRLGAPIVMERIVARSPEKARASMVPMDRLSFDPNDVINNPDIDIVVEVMGGIEPAYDLVRRAIENGKHVVTANKTLIAYHGNELIELAEKNNVDLYFEAAVAGGIPILRVLREALASDRVIALRGIVNGTSNYIMSRMKDGSVDFADALREAQEQGYAEADPTLDVGGGDAAQKLAILATLAFGARVQVKDIYTQGIDEVASIDMRFADRFGFAIKPLAIARRLDGDRLDLRVHPALVDKRSPIAGIHGALNVIHLEAAMLGPCWISGLGAGSLPTAMSVVSDIMDVARNLMVGAHARVPVRAYQNQNLTQQPVQDMGDLVSRNYLRIPVQDLPGVLAQVAGVLGKHGVSIEQMVQEQHKEVGEGPTTIVMLTHRAKERDLQAALKELRALPAVREKPTALRIDE